MIENVKKNNKGITLLALVIIIVIITIIAGITIRYAMEAIRLATLQNTKTNMLLIEAKAKEYVENANFDLGIKPEEATEEMKTKAKNELKGTLVTNRELLASKLPDIGISASDITNGNVYKLTSEDLENMNIRGVESNDEKGWYVIVYNIPNASAKIYHTYGVKLESGEIKYALDDFRDDNV